MWEFEVSGEHIAAKAKMLYDFTQGAKTKPKAAPAKPAAKKPATPRKPAAKKTKPATE
jgi:hypothetical protein